ncbi:MAG: ABC transporter ATP-binding protein [Alphaproteobacteria bacterium]|nr:ABC transporter ATP-binding protein [Alphaproteobacteria bacterium]
MRPLLIFARRYMVPFWHWYVGGTLALLATNWMSVTIPLYLAEGVDALVSTDDPTSAVARSAVAVGLMGLAVIAVRTLSRVLYFTPGRLVEARVKRDLFSAILRHQPSFLRQWETGDLFSRVSSDVNMLRLLAGFGVLQLVNSVIAIVLAGGQMLRLSSELAIWLLGPILVGLVIVQLSIQHMFVLMRRLQVELAALSSHILASYRGVATVQGFAAEGPFTDVFDTRNEQYLRTMLQRAGIRAGIGPALAVATDVNIFLVLFVGGPMVIDGRLTVGELVAFTTLVAFITNPLRSSSFLYSIVKEAQASLERVEAIQGVPPDRPELPHPAPAPAQAPRLEIRHLTFAYPGSEDPALHDVSFTVPAGSTVGILGLTGSGKSTLLALLARLYNPPPGTILVDGTDLCRLDLDHWRERLTLVPQKAFLFSETLADNVLLGPPDEERLARAMRLSALEPDLEALPEGTATLVGEAGVRLSGGQRQRTALARGLVRDHTVLLLDDVLSAVDHATEKELIGTIRGAGSGSTVTTLLVAHRVSALQHADQVVVLDEGRVVDVGRPDELLARPGLFRDTWQQQQAEGA